MIINKVSQDSWRLQLRFKEDYLVWYGPTKLQVKSKYHDWLRDKKFNREVRPTAQPTIVTEDLAHLE